ncbi:MAG: type II toxin-antitoxin system VapC family toxin [Bryobacteraceae bacterium]
MYFDTAYLAKYYITEADSADVRLLVERSLPISTSQWVLAEFHSVLHRCVRQGGLSATDARFLARTFASHVDTGMWKLLPVTEATLQRTGARLLAAPVTLFLRAGDAVHLQTASDAGEKEIWTNDRHMLAAATHFGLRGRSI